MLDTAPFTLTLLTVGAVCLISFCSGVGRRRRLPPGPKGIPVLGNIFDAPKKHEWRTFQEWGRKYDSDILLFTILGTRYIVLNSERAALDLMDKRSSNYSDKPQAPMLELTGWDRNWGFIKYGDFWRAHRRMFHQYFRPNAVHAYYNTSQQAVRELLRLLYAKPEHFMEHVQFMTGYNIIRLMFGVEVRPENDPVLATMEEALRILGKIANPGVYLVDSCPLLRFVPSWIPGAKFKRDAEAWKPLIDKAFTGLYNYIKASYEKGSPVPCLVTEMLEIAYKSESKEYRDMLEDVIIDVSGTAYAAAYDTSSSVLSTFILVMLLYPDVQQEAQKELDQIVGADRLPTIEDQSSLPYVTALTTEILRWRPPLPIGVAHKSVADDEYQGYHIPGGSVIIPNVRAMLHNEEIFPDPGTFNPRRFLDANGQQLKELTGVVTAAFGFGRRICPGRYFAKDVIWLAIANMLAAFRIEKPRDEDGNVVEPSGEYNPGIVSYPAAYKAVFAPRSESAIELVR